MNLFEYMKDAEDFISKDVYKRQLLYYQNRFKNSILLVAWCSVNPFCFPSAIPHSVLDNMNSPFRKGLWLNSRRSREISNQIYQEQGY